MVGGRGNVNVQLTILPIGLKKKKKKENVQTSMNRNWIIVNYVITKLLISYGTNIVR